MQGEDAAKFLKKNVKTQSIDVHPAEKALVVTYEVEATILGQQGDAMFGDTKQCQKIIRLQNLNETTDIASLAHEVVDRCKLIPISKLPEVEQLLFYLQKRRNAHNIGHAPSVAIEGGGLRTDFSELGSEAGNRASVSNLDDYIEMLYEDIPEKVKGTALVLQLTRNPDNLEQILQNETLLGALARVLREESRKSLELATNIVFIFYCFSTYNTFHSMISHFKIGAQCMQLIEWELKRQEVWKDELLSPASRDAQKSKKKYNLLIQKQEQLLRVCLFLLLNMSDDVKTESKMVGRGIVSLLLDILKRKPGLDLLHLTLTFLKKLSAFKENKNEIAKEQHSIEYIVQGMNHTKVQGAAAGLLFNLSFDTNLRKRMIAAGALNSTVPLIVSAEHRLTALKLLYHLSMEDTCKPMFTYTDCIPLCMRIIVEEDHYPHEAAALLINLALTKRNAQLIAGDDGKGLALLMDKAYVKQDIFFFKLVRNIAEHDGPTKRLFIEYVSDIADAVRHTETKNIGICVECVGILGCLNLPELDWTRLFTEFKLVSWIKEKLVAGAADDDVVLSVVVLLGTAAGDSTGAQLLISQSIIDSLIALLSAKQEDDEVVLQIIYVFYHMMVHDSTRKNILNDTQVPAYLIDLMHDKNQEIRKMCDNTLDVIAENGEEWAKKIQEEKFRWHNAQWLEMVGATNVQEDMTNGLERSDVFSEMYGLQSEDILDPYTRVQSRIGYNLSDDEGYQEPVHPLTGQPVRR